MATSPETVLHGHPEVELEYTLSPAPGCSVYGVYKHRPGEKAIILVHPSLTEMRDNFTILHEYGHHVQRQYRDWVDLRYRLPERQGNLVEELISDAFAAEALLPADLAAGLKLESAAALRDYYAHSRASRAAIAARAVTLATPSHEFVAAIIDLDGRVMFARSSGDELFAPARGLAQPGLAALVHRARETASQTITAPLTGGLLTKSGISRNDLHAEVALDPSAPYAFVTIRSQNKFGYQPHWDTPVIDCANLSCAIEFRADSSPGQCANCAAFRCPECGQCECVRAVAPVCPNCTLEYSAVEKADPSRHECPW